MRAVITDVKYRMALPLIRDLGERGVEITVCFAGSERPYALSSRYVSSAAALPEHSAAGEYVEALYDVCRGLAEPGVKPVLLPVGARTLELLADSEVRRRFEGVCHMLIPDREALDRANDKAYIGDLAASLGIPAPRSFSDPREAVLPAVVKPVCGEKQGLHASDRYVVANTPEELTAAEERFHALNTEVVIQERLTGEGLGLSVLSRDGEILDFIAHRRVRELPAAGGPSACCEVIDGGELMPYVKKLMGELRFSGLAMVEFKRGGDGVPRLLEINPRVWGSFPLIRASGSSLAVNWYRVSAGLSPEVRPARVGRRMYFLPSEAQRALGQLRAGRLRDVLAPAGDILSPRCREGIFELRDPAASWGYLGSYLRRGGK